MLKSVSSIDAGCLRRGKQSGCFYYRFRVYTRDIFAPLRGEKDLTLVAHWKQESSPAPEEPQMSTKEAEAAILQAAGDQDMSGATFYKLQARQKISTKKAISIMWKRVPGAANYTIYAVRCGQKMKKVAKVRGSKTSYTKKKLQPGKYYKFIVVANGNGKALAVSKTMHIATKGGSVGNILKLKTSFSKATLKVGKSMAVKVKISKSGIVKKHRNILLESTKPSVATVSKSGKIKAMRKGTCYVYVYAQNGVFSKIKVTVK